MSDINLGKVIERAEKLAAVHGWSEIGCNYYQLAVWLKELRELRMKE